MTESRTLFLRFDVGRWDADEVNQAINQIAETLPDNVNLVATPDEMKFLNEEQTKEMAQSIIDALNETNE